MSFMEKTIDESQMPIAPKHAFKEKSTKLLILPPLRTIYFRTFQCEIPCISLGTTLIVIQKYVPDRLHRHCHCLNLYLLPCEI